jgi:hypothetical protein
MGRSREPVAGLIIVLALLVIAVLVTANEIRFQGCVHTRYAQITINADHPKSPVGVQKCSRLPFGA